jgi:hypothetical protein
MAVKRNGSGRKGGLSEAPPHYHGHRERLRGRFREAGADAVSDYELLELVLFRAIPQRDVKPLAKDLIARFGSFGEVVAAPVAPCRDEGSGRCRHHRTEGGTRRGEPAGARASAKTSCPVVLAERARLLPHGAGLRREGAVPRAVPRQAQPAHRR